jgi:hypothetical protein
VKRDTVALIELKGGRPAPPRFIARPKLASDEPGHPYGQWSLAFELWNPSDAHAVRLAWVQFVSDEAPNEALAGGVALDLYSGTERIGRAIITQGARRSSRTEMVDVDIREKPLQPPKTKAA